MLAFLTPWAVFSTVPVICSSHIAEPHQSLPGVWSKFVMGSKSRTDLTNAKCLPTSLAYPALLPRSLLNIPGLFSFQDSQRSELLETFHKLTIPEPGTSVHLGVVSVGSGRCKLRCLIFIPCPSRGMSKAILSPGACTQVLFSCEELWNSLFTIGALCFPLPNLGVFEMQLIGGSLCVFPWDCLTISSVTWGRSGAPTGHLLPTLLHSSWPWEFEGGAGWEANRHLPVTAAVGALTAHHIFWFLLIFLPPASKNLTQKIIYFIFIFCEKIKQSTLTV